jgi:hypothetical protein
VIDHTTFLRAALQPQPQRIGSITTMAQIYRDSMVRFVDQDSNNFKNSTVLDAWRITVLLGMFTETQITNWQL